VFSAVDFGVDFPVGCDLSHLGLNELCEVPVAPDFDLDFGVGALALDNALHTVADAHKLQVGQLPVECGVGVSRL